MKTKSIKETVREFFFLNPTAQLRVRQASREVGIPLPSAIRYTRELIKEGLLKKAGIAGVTLYSADRSSASFLLEKRIFNLRHLHISGLTSYLVREFSNPPLVVFGSYARGEDRETSDIDLYLETPSNKRVSLEKFEKTLQRKVHLFIYKRIKDVENKELANNILNGVTLNGFVEVFT